MSTKTGVILLLLALTVFSRKAVEKSLHSDFERYYTAGKAVLDGENIYKAEGHLQFKYFPFFAQFMTPFSSIKQDTAVYFWYAFLSLCFIGLLIISLKLSGCPPDKYLYAGFIIILITGRFFVGNARNGQINLPVAFFTFLAIFLVINKHDRSGGIFTALAACLKFMPVLFILFYAWKRRWTAFLYSITGILLFLFIVPAATWGWQGNIDLLSGYINKRGKMIRSVAKKDSAGESVPAVINRLLRKVPANSYKERKDRVYYINLVNLPINTVNRIVTICLCVLLTLYIYLTSRSFNYNYDKGILACDASMMLVLMLLISPEARHAHFITLVMPVSIVTAGYFRFDNAKIKLRSILIISALFILGTSSDMIGDAGASYTSAFGFASLASAFLTAGCFITQKALLNEYSQKSE
ncbi:MAG: glycosyltransferase family 87 protein [Planctomycetota bacterium]|jgi:hypothetical protein